MPRRSPRRRRSRSRRRRSRSARRGAYRSRAGTSAGSEDESVVVATWNNVVPHSWTWETEVDPTGKYKLSVTHDKGESWTLTLKEVKSGNLTDNYDNPDATLELPSKMVNWP